MLNDILRSGNLHFLKQIILTENYTYLKFKPPTVRVFFCKKVVFISYMHVLHGYFEAFDHLECLLRQHGSYVLLPALLLVLLLSFTPQLQAVIEYVVAITVVIWLCHFLFRLLARRLQIRIFHLPLTDNRCQNQAEVFDKHFSLPVVCTPKQVHSAHHFEVIQFKFESTDHASLQHEG